MKYKNNKIVYEAGDWVAVKVGAQPLEIKLINDVRYGQIYYDKSEEYCIGNISDDSKSVRPATQEEIDKTEDKIMVDKYEVQFVDDYYKADDGSTASNGGYAGNHILVGCVRVTKETFLKIGKKAGWQ